MNKLTKYACILTTLAGAVACSGGKKAQGDYAIIPLPQEVVTQGSAPFLLKPSTPISYQEGDAEMEQTARFLASYDYRECGQRHSSVNRFRHPEPGRLPPAGQRERHRDRRSIQRRYFLWRADLA